MKQEILWASFFLFFSFFPSSFFFFQLTYLVKSGWRTLRRQSLLETQATDRMRQMRPQIFRNLIYTCLHSTSYNIVTVLPQKGVWRAILNRQPWLLETLQSRKAGKEMRRKEEEGLPYGPEPDAEVATNPTTTTIDQLAVEQTTDAQLAAELPKAIKRVARHVTNREKSRYSYEEWVEFTRLIRFTVDERQSDEQEDQRGMVEWDWIGEDSPMMANTSEAEFVLDRLCESLSRYVRRMEKTLASAGDGNKAAVDAGNDLSGGSEHLSQTLGE